MQITRPRTALTAFLLGVLCSQAAADNVVADDQIVQGDLCVGTACANGETFGDGLNEQLKVKGTGIGIVFDDTGGTSVNDWALKANAPSEDSFFIEDLTGGTVPFKVLGTAPDNSLYVASNGDVGLGTSIPQTPLHVTSQTNAGIVIERTNAGGGPQSWEIATFSNGDFVLFDRTNGTGPFAARAGTPNNAIFLEDDTAEINAGSRDYNFNVKWDNGSALWADGGTGKIGMGTNAPEELLHIQTNTPNTDAFALFDANAAGSDAAFRLRQNGVIPTTWEFRNQQDSGRLNVGLAGGNTPFKIDNAANNNLLRLGRNGQPGEVNITGTLVVNNTALNVPDYVFADDYALRPLAEVRTFIDTNSHLPDVPSEAEIKANGVDMTAMQMVHLKKIEELTLYTLEQDDRISTQDARIALQEDRIARLEAALAALSTR